MQQMCPELLRAISQTQPGAPLFWDLGKSLCLSDTRCSAVLASSNAFDSLELTLGPPSVLRTISTISTEYNRVTHTGTQQEVKQKAGSLQAEQSSSEGGLVHSSEQPVG